MTRRNSTADTVPALHYYSNNRAEGTRRGMILRPLLSWEPPPFQIAGIVAEGGASMPRLG